METAPRRVGAAPGEVRHTGPDWSPGRQDAGAASDRGVTLARQGARFAAHARLCRRPAQTTARLNRSSPVVPTGARVCARSLSASGPARLASRFKTMSITFNKAAHEHGCASETVWLVAAVWLVAGAGRGRHSLLRSRRVQTHVFQPSVRCKEYSRLAVSRDAMQNALQNSSIQDCCREG